MPTLHASEKTDPGMLPQSQALESTSADNPGVGTKRGVDTGRATGRATGVQHGRGETPVGLTNQQERRPSSPEQSGGEGDRGLAAPPSSTAARVFVVDRHGNPLMPCHPARARKLLASGRARVHRSAPFVIRLVDRTTADSVVTGVEVGIDPGSKFTGISVFQTTPAGRVGLALCQRLHPWGERFHVALLTHRTPSPLQVQGRASSGRNTKCSRWCSSSIVCHFPDRPPPRTGRKISE